MGIAWFPGISGALTKLLDCKTSVDILEVGASSGLSLGATWLLSIERLVALPVVPVLELFAPS